MADYKLVIFDFDGTLANSFPWLVSIFNALAEIYRFKKIQGEDLNLLRNYKASQIMKRLGICYLSGVQKCSHTKSFSLHPGLPPRWSYTLSTSL
jgi:FMN phosphatase YigB (HAD superfamily)